MATMTRRVSLEVEWDKAIQERMGDLRGQRSPGIHLTETVYCLTKSYYDKMNPLPHTGKTNLFFAIGLGLESVLFPSRLRAGEDCKDGIYFSPDLFLGATWGELKTTRYGVKKFEEGGWDALPEGWRKQIMGYCYGKGVLEYNLMVLHIIPAERRGYHLAFEQDELWDEWIQRLGRKAILEQALERHEPPEPFEWRAWDKECENCNYALRCGTPPSDTPDWKGKVFEFSEGAKK